MKLTVSILVILVFVLSAIAQNDAAARDQLKQYVADLQKSPDDQALREKIIKLAMTMKPAPQVPREALEHEGAGEYISKNAKSEADFAKAAAEYEKASLIAPWAGNYYYNIGLLYEKSGQAKKAVPFYELYLATSPTGSEADGVVKKIGAMKYAATAADEQKRATDDAAERERQKNGGMTEFRRLVEGKEYRMLICGESLKPYGCNWNQFNGPNWAMSKYGNNVLKYQWEFRGDDAYLRIVGTSQYVLRVRPNGPTTNNLVWEIPDYSNGYDNVSWDRLWRETRFVRHDGAFADIAIGILGPNDDPPSTPNKAYQYAMYRTP